MRKESGRRHGLVLMMRKLFGEHLRPGDDGKRHVVLGFFSESCCLRLGGQSRAAAEEE